MRITIWRRGVPLLCLWGIIGCVDTEGRLEMGSDAPVTLLDPCRDDHDDAYLSIEDFELGIGRQWWVSSDGTGTMTPLPGREPEARIIEGGRCGISLYGLRVQASGQLLYGGGVGISFFPDPVDASAFDGVAFWARRENGSGESLFISVSDRHTDEYNGVRISEDGFPWCEESPERESDKCDRFGTAVGLDTDWRFYRLPFSRMSQMGIGKAAPFLDTSALLGVSFSFETGVRDFWIDDVALYRHP